MGCSCVCISLAVHAVFTNRKSSTSVLPCTLTTYLIVQIKMNLFKKKTDSGICPCLLYPQIWLYTYDKYGSESSCIRGCESRKMKVSRYRDIGSPKVCYYLFIFLHFLQLVPSSFCDLTLALADAHEKERSLTLS